MLGIAPDSPASGARFVGKNWGKQDTPPKKQNPAFRWLDFTRAIIFYKPNFAIENGHDLKKRQSRELAETFAKNWLCEKATLPEQIDLTKKPEPNLLKLLLKNLEANFENLTLPKRNASQKKRTLQNETALLTKTWLENLEANLRNLSKFDMKLFEQKPWADFEETKIWKLATAKNAKLHWTRKLAENRNPDLQDSKR